MNSTLTTALTCLALDAAAPLSQPQRRWLQDRLAAQTPLTAAEHAKLVPVLLQWSAGRTWEAVLIEGLQGVVDDALLPTPTEAREEVLDVTP